MQVLIKDIIIKDRVRTEIGDLKPLMNSMRLHGQLNPVTLSRKNELIAGHRRTLAARELGWQFIEAHIVERATEVEKLQLELEENVHRKDFSPEELLAGYRRLDTLLHPTIGQRIGGALRSFFGKIFRRKKKRPTTPPAEADQNSPDSVNNATGHNTTKADGPEKPGDGAATDKGPTGNNTKDKDRAQTEEKEADIIGSQFGV